MSVPVQSQPDGVSSGEDLVRLEENSGSTDVPGNAGPLFQVYRQCDRKPKCLSALNRSRHLFHLIVWSDYSGSA